MYWIPIIIAFFVLTFSAHDYDPVIIHFPFTFDENNSTRTQIFQLTYSNLSNYETICKETAEQLPINGSYLLEIVQIKLSQFKYKLDQRIETNSAHLVKNIIHLMLERLLTQRNNSNSLGKTTDDLFLSSIPSTRWPFTLINQIHPLSTKDISIVKALINYQQSSRFLTQNKVLQVNVNSPMISIYLSMNAYTGGRTALIILAESLIQLGYNVQLCEEKNCHEGRCSQPTQNDIVITGEWCNEVLQDYLACANQSSSPDHPINSFIGRGIQYYLGFHHANDMCRGRIAITNSHYLNQLVGLRMFGSYYFGCPMTSMIKEAYLAILEQIQDDLIHSDDNSNSISIQKENLIIFDPDFHRDYPPRNLPQDRIYVSTRWSSTINGLTEPTEESDDFSLLLSIPEGYEVIFVEDIPHNLMLSLLQRAKIIVDLGLPGVERLAYEGILFGAIPILSERWLGSSLIDFGHVNKVNHFNASEISDKILYVANHYDEEIIASHNLQFYSTVLSMWSKLPNTVDILLGSSTIHFILYVTQLSEEYQMLYQILGLLYVFPMCSIDIYVADIVWFMRHHYLFFDLLKRGGYIRHDPFDPSENVAWGKDFHERTSFIFIRSTINLNKFLKNYPLIANATDQLSDSNLIPTWKPNLILIPTDFAFCSAEDLVTAPFWQAITQQNETSYYESSPIPIWIASPTTSLIESVLQISAWLTNKDMVTVCSQSTVTSLINLSKIPPNQRNSTSKPSSCPLHHVIQTMPWKTLVTFHQALSPSPLDMNLSCVDEE